MSGLPHFKNDHAGMEKWEPVLMNLFEVSLVPPDGISWNQWSMHNVRSISGLDVEKMPGLVEQIFKGSRRRYAGGFPDTTTADITIAFEVNLDETNSMFVYKGLRKWCDLIFNPLTGSMSLKKDYAGGPMVVSMFNRRGDIFRQITFPVVWPMAPIGMMDMDYEGGGGTAWQIEMQFAADYWEDVTV